MRTGKVCTSMAVAALSTMGVIEAASGQIRAIPGLTAITVYESTPYAYGDPHTFAVPASGGAVAGFLGGFPGSGENYRVNLTDALGNSHGDGNFITMRCRYPAEPSGSPGGAFNISGVTLTIGGTEYFANTIIAFQYGFDPVLGSEVNAIDGNLSTCTYFDTTGLNPSVPDMSLTLGWTNLPAPSGVALFGVCGLLASRRRRR